MTTDNDALKAPDKIFYCEGAMSISTTRMHYLQTEYTRTDPDTQLIATVECECDELRDKIRQRGEFCKACGEDALAELTTLQAKHLKVCGWYEKWKDQIPAESRDELNDIYLKG